jgi:hypothetical protein
MKKTSSLLIRIDPQIAHSFKIACTVLGLSMNSVLSHMMAEFVEAHQNTIKNK